MGKDGLGEGAESGSEVIRRFQFYGRRKGHKLHARQASLVESLLPKLRFEPGDLNPQQKTWLEIGFGGGEHVAHQAALHPDVAFIGAEPFINGVAKLLTAIAEQGLENIRIFDDDARYLIENLADSSLDRIYVLYPDPWPKARHLRRRLVTPETVGQFHKLLKPSGLFFFASDIADYVGWTCDVVERHGGFRVIKAGPEPFEHWIETRYEAKARREGRASQYLILARK